MLIRYIFRFVIRWHGLPNTFASQLQKIVKKSHRLSRVRHILVGWSISFLFLILAAPHLEGDTQDVTKTGIDIVLVLDLSKSMLADDFSPNRFAVAKQVLIDFVDELETDRLWLVVFAGKPFTSVPLTFDYEFVMEIIQEMTTDTINQWLRALQGTAIGDALLSAVGVLEKGRASEDDPHPQPLSQKERGDIPREQIIVLLTDGESTPGTLDPIVVSQLAAEQEVSIYTVGIGSLEWWFLTYQTPFGIQKQQIAGIDETTLQKISEITNANYRRATDEQTFRKIFDEISQLSKSEISVSQYTTHTPYWKPFAWGLLASLLLLGVVEGVWRVDRG